MMQFKKELIGLFVIILFLLFSCVFILSRPLIWKEWFKNNIDQPLESKDEKKWYLVSEVIEDNARRKSILWNLESKGFVVNMKREKNNKIRLYVGDYPSYEHALYSAQLIDFLMVLTPTLSNEHF